MNKFYMPEFVKTIISRLNQAGYEAFIVGGSVRDILLGYTPHDWDIATSAHPDMVKSLFEKTVDTGAKHGTVTVIIGGSRAEVTTFRTESAYSDRRHPDEVSFVANLKQDLMRRDFTVNAMAMTLSGRLIDYFAGALDLEKGIIRCVGDPKSRFQEDALRMLRAIRFKAVFGFEIETETFSSVKECAHLTSGLSAERVRDEIRKIILSGSPETFETVIDLGLLNTYLKPSAVNLDGLSGLCADENVRFCALCFLLNKNGNIQSVKNFLTDLKFSSKSINLISSSVEILKAGIPNCISEVKRLLRDFGLDAVSYAARASLNNDFSTLLEKVLLSGECYNLKQLAVNGEDIGLFGITGTEVGKILSSLLEHVIDYPDDNERNILLNMAKYQFNNHLT